VGFCARAATGHTAALPSSAMNSRRTRPCSDLTDRFSLIAEALTRLWSRSYIIDGEAVACDDSGVAQFNRIRYRSYDATVLLYAFDLIELNGDDLRREPFETRKATLASVLAKAAPGLHLNEHIETDGLPDATENWKLDATARRKGFRYATSPSFPDGRICRCRPRSALLPGTGAARRGTAAEADRFDRKTGPGVHCRAEGHPTHPG